MKRLFFLLYLLAFCQVLAQPWTHTYKCVFSEEKMHANRTKSELLILQANSLPFTQLIFSWNAFRPERGKFSFFLRIRDQETQQWDQWHKILEWGAQIQKSFFNRGTHSYFNYARLEMNTGKKGDAFQLKVIPENQASLKGIKALMMTASDFSNFESEPYKERGKGLRSCLVKNIPKKSQIMIDHPRAGALCSPTSMSMVVEGLSEEKVDPLEFANFVYDEGLDAFGNWGFNMAHAFERTGSTILFSTVRLNSFRDLHELLLKNIPVAVSVRGHIKGACKEYKNGHLLVVIGFDAQQDHVICYDPAFDMPEEVEKRYNLHDFIVSWERSRRLTYKPEVID